MHVFSEDLSAWDTIAQGRGNRATRLPGYSASIGDLQFFRRMRDPESNSCHFERSQESLPILRKRNLEMSRSEPDWRIRST